MYRMDVPEQAGLNHAFAGECCLVGATILCGAFKFKTEWCLRHVLLTTQQMLDFLSDRDLVFQIAVCKTLSEWVLVTASPLHTIPPKA